MKLTKKEAKLFKESHNRWLNESSFLARLFLKQVTSGIKNDKDLQKMVVQMKDELEKIKEQLNNVL